MLSFHTVHGVLPARILQWSPSLTQWTWIWANARRQWRSEEPGVLQSMGLQSDMTERPYNDKCVAQEGSWLTSESAECDLVCLMPELSGPVTLTRASDPWGHRAPEKQLGCLSSWFRKGLRGNCSPPALHRHIQHTHTSHIAHSHTPAEQVFVCLLFFWLHCLCCVGRRSYPLATKFSWDLSSLTIDQMWVPCIERWTLNHWATKKSPEQFLNSGQSLALWRQYQVQGSFYHVVMRCFGNVGSAGGIRSLCHIWCYLYFPGVRSPRKPSRRDAHYKNSSSGHRWGSSVGSQRWEAIMGWPTGRIPFLLHDSPMKLVFSHFQVRK